MVKLGTEMIAVKSRGVLWNSFDQRESAWMGPETTICDMFEAKTPPTPPMGVTGVGSPP